MQHEDQFDKDHPQGQIKTLDDIVREAALRDRPAQLSDKANDELQQLFGSGVMPRERDRPFRMMMQRAYEHAQRVSRCMTGFPKPKPPAPDKFEI